jgi:hypothetical protein
MSFPPEEKRRPEASDPEVDSTSEATPMLSYYCCRIDLCGKPGPLFRAMLKAAAP